MYGDRLNQLDIRLGKVFKMLNTRTLFGIDIYNALNINSVTSESSAYAVWRSPLAIIDPRVAKISLQFDF
jgi:hypothetical protein